MTKEMITIHNAETGEVIKREMTKAEADLLATDQAEAQRRKEADASKAIEKAALLAKLGITELEAALLLS
jgi:hypothetical protein